MQLERVKAIESEIKEYASFLLPKGFKVSIIIEEVSKVTDEEKAVQIVNEVCEYYNLKPEDLKRKRRTTELVKARKFVCYLIKEYTRLSLRQMAGYAGYRSPDNNHTNALHAINSLQNWIDTDVAIKSDYVTLKSILRNKSNI